MRQMCEISPFWRKIREIFRSCCAAAKFLLARDPVLAVFQCFWRSGVWSSSPVGLAPQPHSPQKMFRRCSHRLIAGSKPPSKSLHQCTRVFGFPQHKALGVAQPKGLTATPTDQPTLCTRQICAAPAASSQHVNTAASHA